MQQETRSFLIDHIDVDVRANTMAASISSEMPVERQGGMEILSHEPGAIDLSRQPLPLIISHDSSKINIGLVSGLKIVGKKLKGMIRFGERKEAVDIFKDVKNGILKYLSVGYKILETKPTKDGYIATKWMPFEVSIVSTPADISVGFGRSKSKTKGYNMKYTRNDITDLIKRLETATGSELMEIGAELDKAIAVVFPGDAARFSDVGARGMIAWSQESEGPPDKTPIDTRKDKQHTISPLNRDSEKGYEFRSYKDGKSYEDLYGQGLNKYTWTDKETTYFQALFSGRSHPLLTKRAMVEGSAGAGGFLVPVEYSKDIHNVALEDEIIMPRANVIPMATNELKIPALEIGDHSSNLYGGFIAYWAAEQASLTEAEPLAREIDFQAKKLTGLVKFSNELMGDMIGGEKELVKILGRGLSWYRDSAFFSGSGAGEPSGLLNSNCKITVDKEVGQGAETIILENLASMLSRLYAGGYKNAIWICSQSCIPQLLTLSLSVGTGGSAHPAMTESDGGCRIFGIEVVFSEKREVLGTEGDIVLTDLSQYAVGMREELRVDLSQHVYFTTDMGSLRLIARMDGMSLWDEALTLKDGSTTVSPIVTLQTRS